MSVFSNVPRAAVKTVALRIKTSVFDCAKTAPLKFAKINKLRRIKAVTFFILYLSKNFQPRINADFADFNLLLFFAFLREIIRPQKRKAAKIYGSLFIVNYRFNPRNPRLSAANFN